MRLDLARRATGFSERLRQRRKKGRLVSGVVLVALMSPQISEFRLLGSWVSSSKVSISNRSMSMSSMDSIEPEDRLWKIRIDGAAGETAVEFWRGADGWMNRNSD